MRYIWPVKTVSRLIWYSKHESTHVLVGLVYAWFLRESWGSFSTSQIFWAALGSLLPDLDHLIYFFFYGRSDAYSLQVKQFLRQGQLVNLFRFVAKGHKYNTDLWSHNVYIVSLLFLGVSASSLFDWQLGMILFGSMVLHLLFDIVDDLIFLGYLNTNWRRWGRGSEES